MIKTDLESITEQINQKQLSLVVELVPGAADNGHLTAYPFGEYNLDATVSSYVNDIMNRKDHTIEDQAILERIKHELNNGSIIVNEQRVPNEKIINLIRIEKTIDNSTEYAYLPVRVVRPQEGGYLC